jgi:hypothetical protein
MELCHIGEASTTSPKRIWFFLLVLLESSLSLNGFPPLFVKSMNIRYVLMEGLIDVKG